MDYRSLGNGINGAVECIDTLANILALTLGSAVTSTTVPARSKASPNDVAGCTLEMGAAGWLGNIGTLTEAQLDALPTTSLGAGATVTVWDTSLVSKFWTGHVWQVQITATSIGLLTTTSIYVDGNRTDTYTPTGTTAAPHKTITAALATVTQPTQIVIATGTYTESATAFPAFPLVFFANNAQVTFTNALTIQSSFRSYDANLIGNITYSGAATDRYFLSGGYRSGNITLTNGLLHVEGSSLLSGLVTVAGGTLEILATTCTSQFSHTAGNFLMQQTNVNGANATAMIASTASSASSSFQIVNSIVANLGTGTALDISGNTQATAHANGIANSNFLTASAASVIGGSAVLEVADCNYTVPPTGTGFTGTNWGFLGNRTISTGSSITGYGTGTIAPFVANNILPGRGFAAYNTSSGIGFYVSNGSFGRGFVADNNFSGMGFDAYNTSSGTGVHSNNTSTSTGIAARFENAGSGVSLSVQGSTVFDPAINSGSVTLYKYSNNKQAFSGSGTVTIDVGAIGAYCNFELLTRNVALTLTTSGGAAVIYKGGAAVASVSLPATQSCWNIKCDGTYVYIQ